jgi:hypothetical protein
MSHDFCAVRSRVISEGLVAQIHETFPDGVAKGFAEKFPKEWVKGLWGRLARRFVDALGDGLPKQSARPSDEGLSEPTGEGSTEYQEEWSTEGTPEQTGEGSTEPSGEGSLTPARMRSPNCRTAEYPSSGPPTPEASPSGAKPAAGAAGEEDRRTEKPTNPAPAEPTVEERVTAVCEALARQDLETAVEDGDRVKNRPAWLRAAVANRLEADGPALRSEAARRPEASLGDLCLAFGGWDPDDPDGSKRAAESAERGRREILEPAQRWEDWCAEADRRIGAMAADERDGLRDGLTATIVAKREARGGKRRTGPLNGELTVAMREAVMGCEPDTWTEWPGAVAHRRDTGER